MLTPAGSRARLAATRSASHRPAASAQGGLRVRRSPCRSRSIAQPETTEGRAPRDCTDAPGVLQRPRMPRSYRWGARRVMVVFLSLLGLGTVLFAASRTYPESVGARALIGAGAAAIWVPGMRLITEWFPPEERGRATGVFSAGGGVGGTLALVGVPWLADRWGWRLAYGATAVPVLALLPLIA